MDVYLVGRSAAMVEVVVVVVVGLREPRSLPVCGVRIGKTSGEVCDRLLTVTLRLIKSC